MKDETKFVSAVALLDREPIPVTVAGLPKTIRLFRFGVNPSTKGDFVVNETTLEAVKRQIDGGVFRRVVVDFEHQSEKASPNYKPPPRHHAAYGDVAITADNSIVLQNVEYTATGVEFAPDFYDVSPVPVHTKDGVILGIKSVGLVTQGAMVESTLFSAELETTHEQETDMLAKIAALETALAAMNTTLDGVKSENAALRQMVEDQAKLIPPPATPLSAELLTPFLTPVQARADGAASAVAAHQALLDAQADGLSAQKTLLDAQAATIADQGQQISVLSAAIDAQRKETLVQLAAVQGKAVTLSDSAIAALSVEDLAAHISATGATVPLVRKTPGNAQEKGAATCLAADQNALIAQIRKDTGETNFTTLWGMARKAKPELFA